MSKRGIFKSPLFCPHPLPSSKTTCSKSHVSGVAPANQTKERSVHELFAGAFRNKSSICESCLFSQGKTPEFTKKGEIHELFVLALFLVWFAGATPECMLCHAVRFSAAASALSSALRADSCYSSAGATSLSSPPWFRHCFAAVSHELEEGHLPSETRSVRRLQQRSPKGASHNFGEPAQ